MPIFDIYDQEVPRRVIVDGERITIGRTADNLVIIHEKLASRQHCEVRLEVNASVEISDEVDDGQSFVLRDLCSRNGTYLNQERISGPTSLNDGDEISIGDSAIRFWASTQSIDPAAAKLPLIKKTSDG